MEVWKPVFRFEDLYEISNLGNVRRIQRGKKFSAEQIDQAKSMFANGAQLKQVAEFLNTSITTAFSIKHGKTWSGSSAQRPITPIIGTDMYYIFQPCKKGVKIRKYRIHRAVWEAFHGEIQPGMDVNHKNLNRLDNRLENLEVLTHKENVSHARAIYLAEGSIDNRGQLIGRFHGKTFKDFTAACQKKC